MFLSRENNINKRMFRRPNILRKCSKTLNNQETNERNVTVKSLNISNSNQKHLEEQNEKKSKHKCSKPCHKNKKIASRIKLDTYICEESRTKLEHVTTTMSLEKNDSNLKTSEEGIHSKFYNYYFGSPNVKIILYGK